MSNSFNLLIVEDSETDTWLILRQLQRGGYDPDFLRVETLDSMREALGAKSWDVIISDYSLPQFSGLAALALYHRQALDIPFIMVSGVVGEETAVEIMKAGAHDYVMKNNLTRLGPAVQRELLATRERRARKQTEAERTHLAALVNSCQEAVVGTNLDGKIISWNSAAERLYGYAAAEMVGRNLAILAPPYRPRDLPEFSELVASGEQLEPIETVRIRPDGQPVEVSVRVSPIKDDEGSVVGVSTVAHDISRAKEDERARLKLIEDLTAALAHVKTLGGLLPICSACKKIRDDQGYWEQVETYVKKHSDAEFSHGLCPDCAVKIYPTYRLGAGVRQGERSYTQWED